MAFGIKRKELQRWKQEIDDGKIAFLTHYWIDERFPGCKSVTKVGCSDLQLLANWGRKYGLLENWIHHRKDGYSHFDLLGEKQFDVLEKEGLLHHLERLNLLNSEK